MIFNEDSRVKVPALIHFIRLGYSYQSKKGQNIDPRNNIFVNILKQSVNRINNADYSQEKINDLLLEIEGLTDNRVDKGKSFFERLVTTKGTKLIDLKNPGNNDFRVVSELTYKRNGRSFRPDITILINGIPLGFLEAKKPNNPEGIQAEFYRMKERADNPEFIPYLNQMQLLAFSNNTPYKDDEVVKMQGGFYTTPNHTKLHFNHFREENEIAINSHVKQALIDEVLRDNNIEAIKNTPEFETNLSVNTPCNSFITSLFSKERIIYFIRYGIVYVNSLRDGLNKHIIRYPQFFALIETINKIEKGMKRGVIWHTQGSGKTALAFFMSNVLRDYYQSKGIITKFYFIVDRLDLLNQATDEFSSRGMTIAAINNREDFSNNIKSSVIVPQISSSNYIETMNIVNIQKFTEDSVVDKAINKKIQRIYFLDEVHRGYKPKGTFLANLLGADQDGIYIGLTGTPILKEDFKTTDLFDTYIHKYYYNRSIADGYTLKIKKDNISTKFKEDIKGQIGTNKGIELTPKIWEELSKKPNFIEKLGEYLTEDFNLFRETDKNNGDSGFMIVASSSEQAKLLQNWFEENSNLVTGLILYDQENNKNKQDLFRGKKSNNSSEETKLLDGVIVFNMLLTGFDAPRLKRLYLLRKIREHSLLQTLARVNRPFKNMKYGHVVDFVDITEEYETTNQRYLEELRGDLFDDENEYDPNNVIIDIDKIKEALKEINNRMFKYMGNIEKNLELFQIQIQAYDDQQLRDIRDDIFSYMEIYNQLRISHEDTSIIPIDNLRAAYNEVVNRLRLKYSEKILLEDELEINDIDITNLIIDFIKVGEVDLSFTTEDDIVRIVTKVNNALSSNMDKKDRKYIDLEQNFRVTVFKLKNDAKDSEQVKTIISDLENIFKEANILNSDNAGLISKYNGSQLSMKFHKRLLENYSNDLNDLKIEKIINMIMKSKEELIDGIEASENVIKRELLRPVRDAFKTVGINLSAHQANTIIMLFIND